MSRITSQASAIALAFISLSPLSVAFADAPASAPPARVATPTPTVTTTAATAPSLSEPSPTPGWAEVGPTSGQVGQKSGARRSARHYAYRSGGRYDGNPVRTAATGVAGGVADLGSIAAYPFYCFPNYGSCSVKMPYRF
jgi:hypothetical protein